MTAHRIRARLVLLVMSLALTGPALAHTAGGAVTGLQSGLIHPITGLDHLVAMVAVGLWGAQLGPPALWALPIVFPLVMAFGGILGIVGVTLPFAETVVALSGVVLGLMVALRAHPPLAVALLLVAVFAIFHGYAHGRELPEAADPLPYAAGFVVATGLLHLCGIAIGLLTRWPTGERAVRACGAAIAGVAACFLFGVLA